MMFLKTFLESLKKRKNNLIMKILQGSSNVSVPLFEISLQQIYFHYDNRRILSGFVL